MSDSVSAGKSIKRNSGVLCASLVLQIREWSSEVLNAFTVIVSRIMEKVTLAPSSILEERGQETQRKRFWCSGIAVPAQTIASAERELMTFSYWTVLLLVHELSFCLFCCKAVLTWNQQPFPPSQQSFKIFKLTEKFVNLSPFLTVTVYALMTIKCQCCKFYQDHVRDCGRKLLAFVWIQFYQHLIKKLLYVRYQAKGFRGQTAHRTQCYKSKSVSLPELVEKLREVTCFVEFCCLWWIPFALQIV